MLIFFNVDFWNGTPGTGTALLNLRFLHLHDGDSHMISSALSGRFRGLVKKKKRHGRFSSAKSNCMALCQFEKAKTSVTVEERNKVIPCTALTCTKAATIQPE